MECWGAGVLISVWSEVQTCIQPSWCHCHSLSLASVKSRLVLPFWYQLTWAVPDKGLLNGCVCAFTIYQKQDNRPVSCGRRFFSSSIRLTTPEDFVVTAGLCSVTSLLQLLTCSNDATSISSAELDSSATFGIYTCRELIQAKYSNFTSLRRIQCSAYDKW